MIPPRIAAIIDEVAERHGVIAADVLSGSILRKVARARQEVCAELRGLTSPNGRPPSYTKIGRWLGRDHTSVIFGERRHKERTNGGQ